MAGNYRIKFNPTSMEIEIEGSQQFVETYFDKIQNLILAVAEEVREEPKRGRSRAVGAGAKRARAGKAGKAGKDRKAVTGRKAAAPRRGTVRRSPGPSNTARVLTLLQESPEGITTSELKTRTGLSEQQIWGVVYAAEKQGRVRKIRRGVYTASSPSPSPEITPAA